MKDYVFALVNSGQTTGLVEDQFKNTADAMQWAHYCMGFYRCDSVRVYEGDWDGAMHISKVAEVGASPSYRMRRGGKLSRPSLQDESLRLK